MKKVIVFSVAVTLLMVLAISCDKEPLPPAPPPTFAVSISVVGKGSVVTDKKEGITLGATVNFKFTPDKGNSLYGIKVNGKSINAIIPFDSEYDYSYYGVNTNLAAEITFVETDILMLSIQEPAWRLTKIDIYRVNDGSYSHSVSLTPEQLGRKYYHQYPSMKLKILNSDGSVLGQDDWNLKDSVYTQWSGIHLLDSLTSDKFKTRYKDPVWSEWDNCYTYWYYTYKRKVD
jgi:hypothetical protein